MSTTRINSRTKGKAGELEFARILADATGVRLTRNLEQSRNGGCDLIVSADTRDGPITFIERFAVEVKRYATAKPGDLLCWWVQACRQATAAGKLPLLAYRLDRQEWRVRMPLEALEPRLSDAWEHSMEVSFESFLSLLAVITGMGEQPCSTD